MKLEPFVKELKTFVRLVDDSNALVRESPLDPTLASFTLSLSLPLSLSQWSKVLQPTSVTLCQGVGAIFGLCDELPSKIPGSAPWTVTTKKIEFPIA